MAQIPQISGALTGGKTLTSNNNSGSPSNGEIFSIDGVDAVQKTHNVTQKGEATASQGPAGAGGTSTRPVGIPAAKDPSMAVDTLRDVFSGELKETAEANGYTELIGELEDLSKAIYLSPEKLMNEILAQEKDNTVFANNPLFSTLRDICLQGDEDTRNLVANMLKSLNNMMSKEDIISAVESNIRFLGRYFGRRTTISKSLFQLLDKWTNGNPLENFESLKKETAEMMHSIDGSLQSDAKTDVLTPLVIHNLSRFNSNEYMMRDAFIQLMAQIPSASLRDKLSKEFDEYVSKLLSNQAQQENDMEAAANMSAEKAAILGYLSKLAGKSSPAAEAYRNSIILTEEKITEVLNDFHNNPINGKDSIERLLIMLVPGDNSEGAESIRTSLFEADTLTQLVDFLNTVLEKMPDIPERQPLCDAFDEIIETMAKSGEMPAGEVHGKDSESVKNIDEETSGKVLDEDEENLYRHMVGLSDRAINYIMKDYDASAMTGKDTLLQLLSLIVPQRDPEAKEMMQTAVNNTDNLSDMIEFLNHILENVPDIPERQHLCDAFEEVIGNMAKNQEMATEKSANYESETMKALTTFIDKNVNHPAIKGIDNFNASSLLQSMLNAPGVFTPLAHYIIPLQVENTKAFGELWVDNDNTSGGGRDGEEKRFHLFLTFEVEAVGRFEVDAYSKQNNLNLSVLYPKSYRSRAEKLTDKITKIAAGVGFNVQNFKTGVLAKPHNLSETFPRINENRRSFDVKA